MMFYGREVVNHLAPNHIHVHDWLQVVIPGLWLYAITCPEQEAATFIPYSDQWRVSVHQLRVGFHYH